MFFSDYLCLSSVFTDIEIIKLVNPLFLQTSVLLTITSRVHIQPEAHLLDLFLHPQHFERCEQRFVYRDTDNQSNKI